MFKEEVYDFIITKFNLNTQEIVVDGGYDIVFYRDPSGNPIPYVIDQSSTSAFDYARTEIIPVSEEYNNETPSVNASDRSDYVAQYQFMVRIEHLTTFKVALTEFRDYLFANKQHTIDGYKVAFKTTRGDKQPSVRLEGGNIYCFYKISIYFTSIKNGYIKKDTDVWGMALDTGFGTQIAVNVLTVGKPYEVYSVGTTDWNIVFGTTGVTYSIGDRGTCVSVGTGSGIATLTYQTLTLVSDTYSTNSNTIISNATGKGKTNSTISTGVNKLQIIYNSTFLEKDIYKWIMNKDSIITKDTTFRLEHTFDGVTYEYAECLIVRGGRTLVENGVILLDIEWVEED